MMEPKRLAFRATAYLTTSAIGEARSRPCQGGRLAEWMTETSGL